MRYGYFNCNKTCEEVGVITLVSTNVVALPERRSMRSFLVDIVFEKGEMNVL